MDPELISTTEQKQDADADNTDSAPVDVDNNERELPRKKIRLENDTAGRDGESLEAVTPVKVPPPPPTLAYTTGPQFTSESFKIELRNLPNRFGFNELKKFVENKHHLKTRKIKMVSGAGAGNKQGQGSYVYITFSNEEERTQAIERLNGTVFKGCTLKAKGANAIEDPLLKARAQKDLETDNRNPENEDQNDPLQPKLSADELVLNAATPLYNLDYDTQLTQKQSMIVEVMQKITKNIFDINPALKKVYKGKGEKKTGLICDIDSILHSPRINGYRNKCEFSIGYNPDTSEKTVGFRITSYKKGSISVGPIDKLAHILPPLMIQGCHSFQEFIRTSTSHEPFDSSNHSGVWKQLTVRTTEDNQIMLYLLISSLNLSQDELSQIKNDLKSYYETLSSSLKVTSFYLKEAEIHGTSEKNVPELIFGKPVITECLLGFNYQISPDAFFQINPKGAELLYSTLAQVAELDENTTLVDVCCGTGAIGFSCLMSTESKLGEILGIEIIPSAIVDAKTIADENNVDNKCQFFCGKAEELLGLVIRKAKYEKLVIVVDPPRAGLHPNVVKTIRSTSKIHKLVYVACDANAAMSNFIDFSRPPSKKFRGEPFLPKRVIPVDLFPHTKHYELIILMEREQPKE